MKKRELHSDESSERSISTADYSETHSDLQTKTAVHLVMSLVWVTRTAHGLVKYSGPSMLWESCSVSSWVSVTRMAQCLVLSSAQEILTEQRSAMYSVLMIMSVDHSEPNSAPVTSMVLRWGYRLGQVILMDFRLVENLAATRAKVQS